MGQGGCAVGCQPLIDADDRYGGATTFYNTGGNVIRDIRNPSSVQPRGGQTSDSMGLYSVMYEDGEVDISCVLDR